MVLILPVVVLTQEALAVTPELILGRNRIGEFQGTMGSGFIAWQQNSRAHPDHYDVFARPIDGGQAFKVNAGRTNGANGSIEGDTLLYQQFRGHDSDLKLFDLATTTRSPLPPGVNSAQWEYWPSISGDHLLFGRLSPRGLRRIILFDTASGDATTLARIRGRGTFLAPGQVNGDYAVWSRCGSRTRCSVVRYRISDGDESVIPNQGKRDHAPSVTSDGIVYFARSGGACGTGTKIVRFIPGENTTTTLWQLPNGDDVGTTRVSVDPGGSTTLVYDHFACGSAVESDVWEIVEQGPNLLSVTVDGDGQGSVTSSPAGISCGADCTEIFDPGTGVTLTATPLGDADFAGWGGACTGTSNTCSLTMEGPRSVTATFTTKPVLDVTKSGTGDGTVTSVPAGINCGTDCNQPYDMGTTVTLTATPDGTSTFEGWNGACAGTGTCTVTMNTSQSVTATFNGLPQQLSVTVDGTGSGTVTSSPAGIDCPGTCDAAFDPGETVTLTASPDSTSIFDGWSGACTGTGSCTVAMNASQSVTATFDAVAQQLSVTVQGTGSGTVTSSPGGISCPSTCNATFAPGTVVTLTATPDPPSTFAGWSGDCSGTDPTCIVTMNGLGSGSVTATFDGPGP